MAEASSVTIYDLTEAGRPMWMRFAMEPVFEFNKFWPFSSATSLSAGQGLVLFGAPVVGYPGHLDGGLHAVSFAGDKLSRYSSQVAYGGSESAVVHRNLSFIQLGTLPAIVSTDVYAVAMTVLPDAPIDVATGLQVPTIAVGTNGGVSVIKHDGTVANSQAWPINNVAFDGQGNVVNAGENGRNYCKALAPDLLQRSQLCRGSIIASRVHQHDQFGIYDKG
ncbi:hypothetical protein LP414_27915 [Polaromonas sp. P1(28)-13]|nr:hypothetical protein LP414_27915 [Polaromonas sp. P1(28)-13]